MALARNLNRNHRPHKKSRLPKITKKKLVIGIVVVALALGAFGWWNLSKSTTNNKKGKIEVKYDTGDKPLPQETAVWVSADGGIYLRTEKNTKSKALKLIPNGTQLSATEISDGWYKVTYQNKTGWLLNKYVSLTAPAEDPTKSWKTYQNTGNSYALRYPADWVVQDYGANPATNSASYVAFGPQLAASLDPANLPPVMVRIVNGTPESASASYKSATGSAAAATTVSGLAATSYTYTASSGVQMTTYVVAKGPKTFVIEETGGYADQLQKIISSLSLG